MPRARGVVQSDGPAEGLLGEFAANDMARAVKTNRSRANEISRGKPCGVLDFWKTNCAVNSPFANQTPAGSTLPAIS